MPGGRLTALSVERAHRADHRTLLSDGDGLYLYLHERRDAGLKGNE